MLLYSLLYIALGVRFYSVLKKTIKENHSLSIIVMCYKCLEQWFSIIIGVHATLFYAPSVISLYMIISACTKWYNNKYYWLFISVLQTYNHDSDCEKVNKCLIIGVVQVWKWLALTPVPLPDN